MHLGIAVADFDPWDFFNEMYADLNEHYQTSLFEERKFKSPIFYTQVNRFLFQRDLQAFMRANEVIFFEWASELLAHATHLPKTCGIITRLHRYEMYRWVKEIKWDNVDKIILVSQAKQKEFVSKYPDQTHKTIVIPETISLEKFKLMPKTFNGDLGILCHLTPRKRVYDLLMAFYELNKISSDFHLHIAGGPNPAHLDYFYSMIDIIGRLKIQDKVTIYGNLTETASWYHNIDIFISNSYSEGLQVSPIEAMASGCFCLSHHWAGADELLPEENLFFTSHELMDKILSYCELSENEKITQKVRMRSIIEDSFDISHTKLQIRNLIEDVGKYYLETSK